MTDRLRIEIEREDDGRWIAEVMDVPGAMAYGSEVMEAIRKALIVAAEAVGIDVDSLWAKK